MRSNKIPSSTTVSPTAQCERADSRSAKGTPSGILGIRLSRPPRDRRAWLWRNGWTPERPDPVISRRISHGAISFTTSPLVGLQENTVTDGSLLHSMAVSSSTRMPSRHARNAWLLLASSVLIPLVASAEGSPRVLECSFLKSCDAVGTCRPDAGKVRFRMEPVVVNAAGAGRYTIRYGTTSAPMQAISAVTPFVWTVAGERNTLLASSDTAFLWHQVKLEPTPQAMIRFMKCRFRE